MGACGSSETKKAKPTTEASKQPQADLITTTGPSTSSSNQVAERGDATPLDKTITDTCEPTATSNETKDNHCSHSRSSSSDCSEPVLSTAPPPADRLQIAPSFEADDNNDITIVMNNNAISNTTAHANTTPADMPTASEGNSNPNNNNNEEVVEVEEEDGVQNRSFHSNSDLTSSFRNTSFISDKGDCRIDKSGIMGPTSLRFPSAMVQEAMTASSNGHSDSDSEATTVVSLTAEPLKVCVAGMDPLTPHTNDDEMVLVCLDCGMDIDERSAGVVCPLTAKLHA